MGQLHQECTRVQRSDDGSKNANNPGTGEEASGLRDTDELILPFHRRVTAGYEPGGSGARQYVIYYGFKEITFDDPEFFGFGEELARQEKFVAGAAQAWGAGYTWAAVRPLLEALILEGVLVKAVDAAEKTGEFTVHSRLPEAPAKRARSWRDCEELTAELSRNAVEAGYLELVLPVYRIIHSMLDGDRRQVGEANVFPEILRANVETQWRVCRYPGSRYQDECPMNVSALRAATNRWQPMMTVLACVRSAYLERFPDAREKMSFGDVECLCNLVMALPTYLVLRQHEGVANGELDPVLSCLFRVVDGVRLTVHQMLLEEPSAAFRRNWSDRASSEEIFNYAERTNGFISEHGVCAGPPLLIQELIKRVVEGNLKAESPDILDPSLRLALENLTVVLDYGLRGCQSFCFVMEYWARTCKFYQEISGFLNRLKVLDIDKSVSVLKSLTTNAVSDFEAYTIFGVVKSRAAYQRVFSAIHEHSRLGLAESETESMNQLLEVQRNSKASRQLESLRKLLTKQCPLLISKSPDSFETLVSLLWGQLRFEEKIVAAASESQRKLGLLLDRPVPGRTLSPAVLGCYSTLYPDAWDFPDLAKIIEKAVGIGTTVAQTGRGVESLGRVQPSASRV